PARMRSGPSTWVTAWRWAAVRPAKMSVGRAGAEVVSIRGKRALKTGQILAVGKRRLDRLHYRPAAAGSQGRCDSIASSHPRILEDCWRKMLPICARLVIFSALVLHDFSRIDSREARGDRASRDAFDACGDFGSRPLFLSTAPCSG